MVTRDVSLLSEALTRFEEKRRRKKITPKQVPLGPVAPSPTTIKRAGPLRQQILTRPMSRELELPPRGRITYEDIIESTQKSKTGEVIGREVTDPPVREPEGGPGFISKITGRIAEMSPELLQPISKRIGEGIGKGLEGLEAGMETPQQIMEQLKRGETPDVGKAYELAKAEALLTGMPRESGIRLKDGSIAVGKFTDGTFDVVDPGGNRRTRVTLDEIDRIGISQVQRRGAPWMKVLSPVVGILQDVGQMVFDPDGNIFGENALELLKNLPTEIKEESSGIKDPAIMPLIATPLWLIPPFPTVQKAATAARVAAKDVTAVKKAFDIAKKQEAVFSGLDDAGQIKNSLESIPSFQELMYNPSRSGMMNSLSESAAKWPGTGSAINLFDPSVVARANPDDAARAIALGYNRQAVAHTSMQALHLSYLDKWGQPFIVDINTGMLTNVTVKTSGKTLGLEPHLINVMEFPQHFNLNTAQEGFTSSAHNITEAWFAHANSKGLDLKRVALEEGQLYFHRQATGLDGLDFEKIVRFSSPHPLALGKPPLLKKRKYPTAQEALDVAGKSLSSDARALVESYMVGMGRMIQAAEAKPFVEALGELPNAILARIRPDLVPMMGARKKAYAAAVKAEDLVHRAIRREQLPVGSIKEVATAHPELARLLEKAMSYRIEDAETILTTIGPRFWKTVGFQPSVFKKSLDLVMKQRLGRTANPRMDRVLRKDLDSTLIVLRVNEEAQKKFFISMEKVSARTDKIMRQQLLQQVKDELIPAVERRADTTKLQQSGILGRSFQGMKEVKAEVKAALDNIRSSTYIKDVKAGTLRAKIEMKGFGERLFDPRDVKAFDTYFKGRDIKVLNDVEKLVNISRFLTLGFDLGWNAVNLAVVLGSRPKVWGSTVTYSMKRFFRDPQAWNNYIHSPGKMFSANQYVSLTGNLLKPEVVRGAPVAKAIGRLAAIERLPVAGRVMRGARGLSVAFSDAYTTAINVGKIELWESLRVLAKNQDELREVARFVTNATGQVSTQALGISAKRRQFEATWILLSPRFTRSTFALIHMAMQRGIGGDLAREALAKLISGATVIYTGTAFALGQEPKLNPGKGDFFTLEIGGHRIGPASGIRAAWKGMFQSMKYAITNPRGFLDPLSRDSPWAFATSKLPPTTGIAMDIIRGRTFLGDRLDDFGDYSKLLASKFMPLALEGYAVTWAGEDRAGLIGGIAEFVGLNAWQRDVYDHREQLRTKYMLKPGIELSVPISTDMDWSDLPRSDQRAIERAHPDLQRVSEDAIEVGADKATGDSAVLSEYFELGRQSTEKMRETINEAHDAMAAGRITGIAFRERADEAAATNRGTWDFLSAQTDSQGKLTYGPAIEEFNKSLEEREDRPKIDQAFDYWMKEMNDPDLTIEPGEFDWKKRDEKEEEFIHRYGQDMWDHIIRRQAEAQDLPEGWLALFIARKELKPYWKIRSDVLERYGLEEFAKRREMLRSSDRTGYLLMNRDPTWKTAQKIISIERKKLLLQRPELRAMKQWFYGN